MYNHCKKLPSHPGSISSLPSRLHRLPSHLRGKATGRLRNVGNGVGVGY